MHTEFQRIRDSDYQAASVAELYLQGWQLIGELNRAIFGHQASDYVAPPGSSSKEEIDSVPDGNVLEYAASGYRDNFKKIRGK